MPALLEILLVGGSGFMGRHVAGALVAGGHRVTVLSRGQREPVAGVRALSADRRDPTAVATALRGLRFDVTVDFMVYDAPDLVWLSHVPGGVVGRYVMISTGQIYLVGEGGEPPYREEDATRPVIREPAAGTREHANWTYGVGKRRAEQALRELGVSRGLVGVALRLPIVQGEGDGSLRLWAYVERMLDGGPLVLPDGGRRLTRFLYAGDLAGTVVRMAVSSRAVFAYNLAQPDVVVLREFLSRVARVAGITPRIVEASWEACRAAGLDGDFSPYAGAGTSILDPSLAGAELGFAGTSLDDYLPRVVHWHLQHRPKTSHPGYAQRPRELELAARRELPPNAGILDPSGAGG